MAEGKVEQDPTMEEILQSIKRIIAEDGDEAAPPQTPPAAAEAPKPAPPPVVAAPVASAPPVVEDVLELTDAVQDDGSVVNVKDGNVRDILEDIDELTKAIEAAEQKGPAPAAKSLEEMLDTADTTYSDVLEVVEEDEETEETFEAHATSSTGEEAMPAFESAQPEARVPPTAQMEPLIEEHVAQATSDAFQQFINALPKVGTGPAPIHSDMATRAGTTVEELLVEAMKPLLKQWLDTYLPETVERIVQDEIRKLIPH